MDFFNFVEILFIFSMQDFFCSDFREEHWFFSRNVNFCLFCSILFSFAEFFNICRAKKILHCRKFAVFTPRQLTNGGMRDENTHAAVSLSVLSHRYIHDRGGWCQNSVKSSQFPAFIFLAIEGCFGCSPNTYAKKLEIFKN